jgi:hypothetical protein
MSDIQADATEAVANAIPDHLSKKQMIGVKSGMKNDLG